MKDFSFPIHGQSLSVGEHTLKIHCLESLDRAVDLFFEYLQATGQEHLLETHCPYFGVVWPAAVTLAQAVVAIPDEKLQGKRVLEIGCGLAIPSMIAALKGAEVTATDFHPEVPAFLERNLRENQVTGLSYVRVDWESEESASQITPGSFDWIIGSDILYERKHPEQVAQTVARFLALGGEAWITDPGRPYLGPFMEQATRSGFKIDSAQEEKVHILKLRRG